MAFGEQHCGEVAADGADGAGGSGHEDRAVVCGFHHLIAGLKLRSVVLATFGVYATVLEGAIRSQVARQRHKIIRNGVALAGKASVSVGHQRHPPLGPSGEPTHAHLHHWQ